MVSVSPESCEPYRWVPWVQASSWRCALCWLKLTPGDGQCWRYNPCGSSLQEVQVRAQAQPQHLSMTWKPKTTYTAVLRCWQVHVPIRITADGGLSNSNQSQLRRRWLSLQTGFFSFLQAVRHVQDRLGWPQPGVQGLVRLQPRDWWDRAQMLPDPARGPKRFAC